MNPTKRKGCIGAVVAVFLLAALGLMSTLLYWHWGSEAIGGAVRAVRVTVAPGATLASVGKDLKEHGVIRSPLVFGMLGRGMTLQPGVYDVSPS